MRQLGLFISEDTVAKPRIPGLQYFPHFLSVADHNYLLSKIEQQPWLKDLKRRVQHYGYKYDYKARAVTKDAYLGLLPHWIQLTAQKLPFKPDQAIVNEYLPGQGISAHIDCVPCFDDAIASLSMGSPVIMQFTNPQTGEKQEILLKERSLIMLTGPARYEWQHAIPARKSDIINGIKTERARRISLTFRTVILN